MRYATLFVALLLAAGCGPSEEQVQSKKTLAKNARQVNAVFQNISDDIEQEGNMTRAQLPSFYDSHLEDLDEVRSGLASAEIVSPYRTGRSELDSVLTLTKNVLKERKDVMSALFDANSSMSDYVRKTKLARKADYSSNRADWYDDAENAKEEYGQAVEDMRAEREQLRLATQAVERAVADFNAFASREGVPDTLSGSSDLGRYSTEMTEMIASIDTLSLP
jgi:enamine deaminase RidA (YjgF/YER057c/UK114 family)